MPVKTFIDLYKRTTSKKMTDRFDEAAALKVFNEWETTKYHPKVTKFQLKSIAGGSNTEAYNEWKAEYEPK